MSDLQFIKSTKISADESRVIQFNKILNGAVGLKKIAENQEIGVKKLNASDEKALLPTAKLEHSRPCWLVTSSPLNGGAVRHYQFREDGSFIRAFLVEDTPGGVAKITICKGDKKTFEKEVNNIVRTLLRQGYKFPESQPRTYRV